MIDIPRRLDDFVTETSLLIRLRLTQLVICVGETKASAHVRVATKAATTDTARMVFLVLVSGIRGVEREVVLINMEYDVK